SDRDRQFTPEAGIAFLALPSTESSSSVDPRPPPLSIVGDAARLSGAFPPLNVLFCVYLD
ncbi:MAG: hypothetical protein PVF63_09140, partial [Gammaproteobacteria bacterium]